jgi:hypothetical protein
MRRIGVWLLRGLIGFAAFSLVAFAVDWTVFALRGSPHSTVAANVSCAVALFPQDGQDPCWHLKRNPNQWENVGTPQY